MIRIVSALTCALFTVVPASAQTIAAPIAAPNYNSAVLRTGTEVPLRLSEELTTKGKKLRVGQRVHLETAEPVIVQGITVIPVGSPAIGEITDVKNKGMWGKSGHLGARVLYVTVNGRQIRLSGAVMTKARPAPRASSAPLCCSLSQASSSPAPARLYRQARL